ncbi:MAG: hypothetical protein K8S18_17220 [Desulfobacula sp.]|nr:hypothetical protein [Desulfobacula sp.]
MKYTDDELIELLQKSAKELGKTPSSTDMRKANGYSIIYHYIKHFGSWNNSLIKAGFEINESKEYIKPKYTDEELIDLLLKYGFETGDIPTFTNMTNAKGYPSGFVFADRFGSWDNALEEAGYDLDSRHKYRYSNNDLIKIIQDLNKELGRRPIPIDFNERDDLPNRNTFYRFGDTWEQILQICGLKSEREVLIDDIHRFVRENGRIPLLKDIDETDGYRSETLYVKHFGSWSNALKEAGYKTKFERNRTDSICIICGKNTKNRHYIENRDVICHNCYGLKQARLKTKFRNGKLHYKSSLGRGLTGELVVQKALNIPDEDNFNLSDKFGRPYDLYNDEYGNINVKYSSKIITYGSDVIMEKWNMSLKNFNIPDTYIALGMSNDRKSIEHVWVFTSDDENLFNKKTNKLKTTLSLTAEKFKKYEIAVSPFNEVYQCMSIEDCQYLTKEKE